MSESGSAGLTARQAAGGSGSQYEERGSRPGTLLNSCMYYVLHVAGCWYLYNYGASCILIVQLLYISCKNIVRNIVQDLYNKKMYTSCTIFVQYLYNVCRCTVIVQLRSQDVHD